MGQVRLATRRTLGVAVALAALVSLVLTYFYTGRVAEEKLAEFNGRDPGFAKKYWAFKETGPRNRLGLEVTPSVGLIEIRAGKGVWPGETFYQGSAVIKGMTGQIWEVVDGKARMLWSPNPLWLVTTDPVLVGAALAALVIGICSALTKTKVQGVSGHESSPG